MLLFICDCKALKRVIAAVVATATTLSFGWLQTNGLWVWVPLQQKSETELYFHKIPDVIHDYFIFVYFKKVATPLFDRSKTVFEILLKEIPMKGLDLQLKLMTLMMVYVEFCARRNVPIHCN